MAFSSNSFDAPLIGELKLDTANTSISNPILYHNDDPMAMDPALLQIDQNQFYDAYVDRIQSHHH